MFNAKFCVNYSKWTCLMWILNIKMSPFFERYYQTKAHCLSKIDNIIIFKVVWVVEKTNARPNSHTETHKQNIYAQMSYFIILLLTVLRTRLHFIVCILSIYSKTHIHKQVCTQAKCSFHSFFVTRQIAHSVCHGNLFAPNSKSRLLQHLVKR